MTGKTIKCPKCSHALQAVNLAGEQFYVCRCGYSTPIKLVQPSRNTVRYVQSLGFRQLTIADEKPTSA